jgi:hypothetical protein
MNEKMQKALDKILNLFQSGDVPEALSITLLPRIDVPSSQWSICNRLLMVLNDTADARGFQQWRLVGRSVKPKSKAFYIICPKTICKENLEGEKESVVIGFRAAPVFRFEDTEGQELTIQHFPPTKLPPLHDVAEHWGINVSWQGYPGSSYGYYSPSKKEIVLATQDEEVFFHELGHAAHQQMLGRLAKVDVWRKEVVAELTAAVLAHLYGKKCNTGGHYRYIDRYAQETGLDAYHACMAVVTDVGACLDIILKTREEILVAA